MERCFETTHLHNMYGALSLHIFKYFNKCKCLFERKIIFPKTLKNEFLEIVSKNNILMQDNLLRFYLE